MKELDKKMMTLAGSMSRRFVKVAPPATHAGVGDALRHAFRMDREVRSREQLEALLARLD